MSSSARVRTVLVTVAICAFATTARAQPATDLTNADQIWNGVNTNALTGTSVAQGAVGGNDSRPDLIIGAPSFSRETNFCPEVGGCWYPTTSGRVYVLFGGLVRTGTFNMTSAETVISGAAVGDAFGYATAAGNVLNTEGSLPQNLVVGAPGVNVDVVGCALRCNSGAVYLFAGGFSNGDSLTTSDAVLTILGRQDDGIGSELATADLNNDGYRDIVIGAPFTRRIYVIYGSASLSGTIDLSTTSADVTISGRDIGRVITAGDVTGDGVDDLLIGSPQSDSPENRGAVYIVYGVSSGNLPATISLPAGADALFLGADPGDWAGSSLRVADIDGDGHKDILVGAAEADGPDNTRTNTGEVYLIWGTGSVLQSISLSEAPVTFFGNGSAGFVLSTTADINGDIPDDLLFGGSGRFIIYYGRSRSSIGVAQPDGRRFVDFATPDEIDRVLTPSCDLSVFAGIEDGTRDVVSGCESATTESGSYAGRVYISSWSNLMLSTRNLRMGAMQGERASGFFEVRYPSPIEITWEATDDQPWLTFTPTAGGAVNTNPTAVSVTASTSGLAPGSYTATLTVASTSGDVETSLPVAVTFNVLSKPTVTMDTTSPAPEGSPITFTAAVTGGTGAFEYKFWRFKSGGGWTMARDYTSSPSWTWTPGGGDNGDYVVQVWVRTTGSSADWEAWAAGSPFTITPVPRVTSLTSSVAFPVATGTPITWTVQTSGGIAPVQFKFWRFKSGAGWTMARDWAASNTHTWTPGAGDTGTYQLQAWVRNAGGTDDPDAWSAMEFTVSNSAPIQGRSLTANRTFPAGTGTPITWTAMASGGTAGPLQYKFWRYNQGTGSWTVVQDYSASSTWTWTPGYDDPGTYVLQVWIRSADSGASYETFVASEPWTVTRTPVTITSVTPSVPSPQPSGTSVTWTAQASGGSGPLEYQFWTYNVTSGTWILAQAYGASNTFTWTTGPAATYFIQVWVRTIGSGVDLEAWANSADFVVQ